MNTYYLITLFEILINNKIINNSTIIQKEDYKF